MYLGLKLVLSGSGLRAAARILQWLLPACGLDDQAPTYQALRLWVLRVGLWELQRPRERADDWIWIVDHTQQLGDKKVLLIVGLRLSDWRRGEPLEHRDLSLLALEPVKSATGEGLAEECERLAQRTGVPRAIVSDGARDLRCGFNLFHERHPGVAWLYDIKHFTAAALKHELEDDPQWKEFTAAANRTKQQCSVTALAALCPPQQRGKARYLNLQELVAWGTKMLAGLDQPQLLAAAHLDPEQCQAKLGWLEHFRQPLAQWAAAMRVIETVESQVRRVGLHRGLVAELKPQLDSTVAGPLSDRLRDKLLAHLEQQAEQAAEQEHLPASSEVLESLIGSYKYLAGEHGQHGVTSLVLAVGALLAQRLPETLHEAVDRVSNADLAGWCRDHLGSTLQACRRHLRQLLPTGTKRNPRPTTS
ncbi:MAG: hypothetical protein L0099_10965 [Acidobacteria bacterium]|nr:hypothetical protein [Acidobacteriota bacterium]